MSRFSDACGRGYDGPSPSEEKRARFIAREAAGENRGISPYDEEPEDEELTPAQIQEDRIQAILEEFVHSAYDLADQITWCFDKIDRLEAKIKELETK